MWMNGWQRKSETNLVTRYLAHEDQAGMNRVSAAEKAPPKSHQSLDRTSDL